MEAANKTSVADGNVALQKKHIYSWSILFLVYLATTQVHLIDNCVSTEYVFNSVMLEGFRLFWVATQLHV